MPSAEREREQATRWWKTWLPGYSFCRSKQHRQTISGKQKGGRNGVSLLRLLLGRAAPLATVGLNAEQENCKARREKARKCRKLYETRLNPLASFSHPLVTWTILQVSPFIDRPLEKMCNASQSEFCIISLLVASSPSEPTDGSVNSLLDKRAGRREEASRKRLR